MCCKMEYKVIVWMCLLIGAVKAMKVDLSSEWKTNHGWVITCSWNLHKNDTLQSVRMYEDDRQFLVYRPEQEGPTHTLVSQRPEDVMTVDCSQSRSSCVVHMQLSQPQTKNYTYVCEASGERPKFLVDKDQVAVTPFVPATQAFVEVKSKNEESGRVMVNCSASGSPAPRLVWKIGEQQVPSDFNGSRWNITSKLWHVWSALSYTHSNQHGAVCTPETSWADKTSTGTSATYNSADVTTSIGNMVFTLSILLLLRR